PNGEYNKAVEVLYAISYTISMSYKSDKEIKDFRKYVVPPLEGLWWMKDDLFFDINRKHDLVWTSMIRQPEFVNSEVLKWALDEVNRKKPILDTSKVRLSNYTEGLCVQMMHIGHFDTEDVTVEKIDRFAYESGYQSAISKMSSEGILKRHHEIYLSDPRKVDPLKMKTVVRHPIEHI
ncbi:MAG: GyrI-like domain-containing protein, partial [Clostridia bacterium]|nr:GyrI-like domain-containing protein [Clostridia bacterium]